MPCNSCGSNSSTSGCCSHSCKRPSSGSCNLNIRSYCVSDSSSSKQYFYRSTKMNTTTVINGSWVEKTSYTPLFADKYLIKPIALYTEIYKVSTEAGAYFFNGNILCYNGQNSIIFGDNATLVPNKKVFVNCGTISNSCKKATVKTVLGDTVVKYTVNSSD